jgi:UDP-GlcNAc:undecaprenyl-phosphate/decaprenyl-phosphate GlcNAc-1-phosphate transferase
VTKSQLLAALGVLSGAAVAAALFLQGRAHYPYVVVDAPGDIRLAFLRHGRRDVQSCQAAAATIVDAVKATCAHCPVAASCLTRLDAEQRRLLSEKPVAFPSASLPDGMIAYRAADAATALAVCRETERLSSAGTNRATCYFADTARPVALALKHRPVNVSSTLAAALILVLSAHAAIFTGHVIVRHESVHARWSHDPLDTGPQKFHARPTPRIGGLCLLAGLVVSGSALSAVEQRFDDEAFFFLTLAALPAFVAGMAEDVTKRVTALERLGLTMLAAAFGIWLVGATLPRLDVPGLDALLLWMPFAIAFTVFAVGGVANSINIIDGYNGLAGGYAVIVLAAFAYVSAQVGDSFLLVSALAMLGAVLGFLVWNYPRGRIFLGDGGAYLVGFWLAEISVLLVVRHPEVSPWFPLLLLSYPVFETLYSIYRRKVVRGTSPGSPDALHMHQLIYMRLVKVFIGASDPGLITRRNSMVASYIWAMAAVFIVPALFVWDSTVWLFAWSVGFAALYVWLYRRLVTWQAPAWLIRHDRRTRLRYLWPLVRRRPRDRALLLMTATAASPASLVTAIPAERPAPRARADPHTLALPVD